MKQVDWNLQDRSTRIHTNRSLLFHTNRSQNWSFIHSSEESDVAKRTRILRILRLYSVNTCLQSSHWTMCILLFLPPCSEKFVGTHRKSYISCSIRKKNVRIWILIKIKNWLSKGLHYVCTALFWMTSIFKSFCNVSICTWLLRSPNLCFSRHYMWRGIRN